MNEWQRFFEIISRLGRKQQSSAPALYRPALEALENRVLLTWTLDSGFNSGGAPSGHALFSGFEGQANAVQTQTLSSGVRKILMGGYVKSNTSGNPDLALIRLNEDGTLDTSFDKPGPHQTGDGIAFASFYNNTHIEKINVITITIGHSGYCGDLTVEDLNGNEIPQVSQKILVAAKVHPFENLSQPPSKFIFGVMRFCGEGPRAGWVDLAWGGGDNNWYPEEIEGELDDVPGTRTINICDAPDNPADCMREGEPFGMAIDNSSSQHPGRIVVAGNATVPDHVAPGNTKSNFAIGRLRADGSYDPEFDALGDDIGKFHFKSSANAIDAKAHGLFVLSNGKIIIAGQERAAPGEDLDLVVAQVCENGTLDTGEASHCGGSGFGEDAGGGLKTGIRHVDVAGLDDIAWGLTRDTDTGRIIAAGQTKTSGFGTTDYLLVGLTAAGVLDAGFGDPTDDGIQTLNVGYVDVAYGVDLQVQGANAGKIVIGGYIQTNIGGQKPFMAGARFDENGIFETGATFESAFTGTTFDGDRARSVKVQAWNDRILAAGFHTEGTTSAVYRFGAIRACQNPIGCDMGAAPGGGGGGESLMTDGSEFAMTAAGAEAVITDSPTPVAMSADTTSPPTLDAEAETQTTIAESGMLVGSKNATVIDAFSSMLDLDSAFFPILPKDDELVAPIG